MKGLLSFIFSVTYLFAASQISNTKIFTVDDFINQVKQFHPVARQASLLVDKASAELLAAKGLFDPTINFDASKKTFDGKNYYYYTNPEIKVPLPIGDIKTGIENNGGTYLNSEESYGKTSYLGLEIPLAKGLILDKRRATLQQAKILKNQSEQEKLKMLNDLLLNAYTNYWQWAGANELFNIYTKYVQISTDRLRLVRLATKNGDRSAMDTLEAFTQLQNIEMMQTEALMKLNSAAIEVSNFLWLQNDSAYQLPENNIPDIEQFNGNNTNFISLNDIIGNAMLTNPNLQTYNFKLQYLEVERKLKKQNLLPTFNAKANLLNKDYAVFNGVNTAFFENNYKWGIDFKMPIFLREARGDYAKAKIKIAETSLDLKQKKWEVENKIRNYFSEYTLLQKQFQIAQASYNNYNTIYKNELLKFINGESSLFLVNSREIKTLEILQKNIELKVKLLKAKYAISWAAGLLK